MFSQVTITHQKKSKFIAGNSPLATPPQVAHARKTIKPQRNDDAVGGAVPNDPVARRC